MSKRMYTFRVTQGLSAFYEGEVSVEASSEKAARNKLSKMTNKKLEEITSNWDQNTDEASPNGDIQIQELINSES